MLGYPGETEESMQETVNFIKELELFDIGAQAFVPFPGSEVYQTAREQGEYIMRTGNRSAALQKSCMCHTV
jgi:radical SAM superfamily enzyme YgiQ (UPF0313 family)